MTDQTIIEQELLPCPFCGGPAELEEVDGGGWSVGCEENALSLHYCIGYQSLTSFATKREAITAWNTRRPPYIGPPCSTCGAAHPFDNVFCSDGFHAPPDATLQSSAVLPSEASDGGYIAAFYDLAKMMGIGARTDAPKVVWEREMRPRLFALLRATTRTAPVQDDDAEPTGALGRAESELAYYRRQGVKLSDISVTLRGDDVEALVAASRLSPTPETGLVEALDMCAHGADRGSYCGYCGGYSRGRQSCN